MKLFYFLTFAILLSLSAADLTDDEYRELRGRAQARPRRVFADNDGCDVTAYPKSKPFTLDGIAEYMNDWIKGCEVDTLAYCPAGVGQMMSFRTKVGDLYYGKLHLSSLVNKTRELHEMGTDGLQLAVEFARANHLEILANMRINDQHERWFPPANYAPFKCAHPEYLVGSRLNSPPYGSWLLFDFNHSEVRARFRAIVNEMLTNYDVDGIIIDFYRSPVLFPSVARGGAAREQECRLVTDLMRQIRWDADAAGKKRHRYQLVTIRVPDSAAMCKAVGIDLDAICREKIIDFLVVGGDDGLVATRADAVRCGQSRGIKTYLSVDARNGSVPQQRDIQPLYTAMAAAAYGAGADGVYYFNTFYHPWAFKGARRNPRDLRFMAKNYWGSYHRRANFSGLCDQLNQLAATDGTDLVLVPGRPGKVRIEIGDDFSDPEVAVRCPEITLVIHAVPGLPPLIAKANDIALAPPVLTAEQQRFKVPASAMRKGENFFSLTLSKPMHRAFAEILTGREIVHYNSRRPWRRLWGFYKRGVTEKIVGDALRLNDCGSRPGDCMNLYYALPASAAHLEGYFDLKVDYSTAPEAVALRLANGENVEVITFEPGKIGLKFAGKSCKFNTSDHFHHYRFQMKSGRLKFWGDQRKLFDAALSIRASDSRARFTGNNDGLPNMYDRSLIIGSLSEAGKGAAFWKHLFLCENAMVKAAELNVTFPEPPDAGIQAAVGAAGKTIEEFSVKSGKFPAHWHSNYKSGYWKITPQGTLLLDNTDSENQYALVSGDRRDYLQEKSGILRIRVRVKPGPANDGNVSSFQLVMRPEAGQNKARVLGISLRPGTLVTPWRHIAIEQGFIILELYYNCATGAGAVVMDGQIIAGGKLTEARVPSLVFFGDGGSSCGGSAELDFVKIEKID